MVQIQLTQKNGPLTAPSLTPPSPRLIPFCILSPSLHSRHRHSTRPDRRTSRRPGAQVPPSPSTAGSPSRPPSLTSLPTLTPCDAEHCRAVGTRPPLSLPDLPPPYPPCVPRAPPAAQPRRSARLLLPHAARGSACGAWGRRGSGRWDLGGSGRSIRRPPPPPALLSHPSLTLDPLVDRKNRKKTRRRRRTWREWRPRRCGKERRLLQEQAISVGEGD